jgi:hypothetical protein
MLRHHRTWQDFRCDDSEGVTVPGQANSPDLPDQQAAEMPTFEAPGSVWVGAMRMPGVMMMN